MKSFKSKVSAILIDGSNLYAATRMLGFNIDFQKLLQTFDGSILKAYYFTALPPSNEQSTLRPMTDWLSYNGWTVVTKETKEYLGQNGEVKIKGNMDVEITTIALEIAPYVSDLILFSGDGDFRFLVETLQRRHCTNVTVVSTIMTQPSMCADSLRRQADVFVDLRDMRQHVERIDRGRGVSNVMGN